MNQAQRPLPRLVSDIEARQILRIHQSTFTRFYRAGVFRRIGGALEAASLRENYARAVAIEADAKARIEAIEEETRRRLAALAAAEIEPLQNSNSPSLASPFQPSALDEDEMAIPTAENDYKSDGETRLNSATWDAVLGSVASRLRTLEAKKAEVQAVIDELRQFGLARIDAELAPKIAETQAALDQLEEDMAAAQAIVNSILASTLPATQVNETATRVFVTPAQRAEIGTLRTDLGTVQTNLGALTTVVGGKALADLSNATGPRGKLTPAPVNTSPNLFLENGRRLFSSTAPNTPASGRPWLIECIVDDTGADQALQIAHDHTRFDQDRALFPSYVRYLRNTVWTPWVPLPLGVGSRARMEFSNQTESIIQVPSWAKGVILNGSVFIDQTSGQNTSISLQVSVNGSTFLNAAGSYAWSFTESNPSTNGVSSASAVSTISHVTITPAGSDATLPATFEAMISSERPSAADVFAIRAQGHNYSSTYGTKNRLTGGHVVPAAAGSALRIEKIRLFTTAGLNMRAGRVIADFH